MMLTDNIAVGGFIVTLSAISALSGIGSIALYQSATKPPDIHAPVLILDRLGYNGSEVEQTMTVAKGDLLVSWGAEIIRDGRELCQGGKENVPYEARFQETRKYTASQWTGDQCPELRDGDIGRGVWKYRSDTGALVTIKKEFVVSLPKQ